MNDAMDGLGKELSYDLRQIYAVEILGEHLKDIARARKSNNFPIYFECLKDVWIVTQHKIKKKKIKVTGKDGKEKEMTNRERFDELMKNVALLANEHKNEWLRQGNKAEAIAALSKALNEVEMFLYDKIEEAKMFGSQRDIPGL